MKGYKGFEKGMICRGKQYAENTVFEEDRAEICKSGIHFCENPFDVLDYYPFVSEEGEINDFAEVEALDEPKTDDGKKYCSKKLKIGARLGISGLVNAFVDFTFEKSEKTQRKKRDQSAATNTGYRSAATNTGDQSAATNTGNWSAATNTGDQSAATNTGYQSAATNTGNWSAATVGKGGSVAIVTGYKSKAKASVGSAICICERGEWDGEKYPLIAIKAAIIDGVYLKGDTFYILKNGEFTEVKE